MKKAWRMGQIIFLLLLLAGCTWPRDPMNTTETVRNNVMVVGLSENPPWVMHTGETPGGIEVELVKRFARQMNAQIEWKWGSLAEHLDALHQYELHLVIGGLTTTSPGSTGVGLTQSYYQSEIIVALPPGVSAPTTLNETPLGVVRGTAVADTVRNDGAEPVFFSDWQDLDLPAAVPSWQVEEWHLEPTDIRLDTRHHVMAVPPGENQWLTELETFLMQQSVNP